MRATTRRGRTEARATVPGRSFRAMVTGRDAAGSVVQRVQAWLFTVVQAR
jgi:hypothetical protein